MTDTRTRIGTAGFVGLGMMGLPLVRHLAESADRILVQDTRPEAVAEASGHCRIEAAQSLRAIATDCGIIFTCLPGPDVLRPVHLDPEGLAVGAQAGQIVVELSTTIPELSAEIASVYADRAAHYIEAMMIGPPVTAEARQLFFIAGGDETVRPRVEAALSAIGRGTSWVGEVGMASRAKLLHNGLGMIHMAATAEIMGLCMASGIDPDAFIEIIRQSPKSKGIGYSTVFDLYAASIAHGHATGTGKLYLAAKDTKLAGSMARKIDYRTPLLDNAAAMFNEAMELGLGEDEYTLVSKVVEQRFGSAIFGKPEGGRD